MKKQPSKRYPATTVIRAQKRVLKMLRDWIAEDGTFKEYTLFAVGPGMMTTEEIIHHIDSARALRVARDK